MKILHCRLHLDLAYRYIQPTSTRLKQPFLSTIGIGHSITRAQEDERVQPARLQAKPITSEKVPMKAWCNRSVDHNNGGREAVWFPVLVIAVRSGGKGGTVRSRSTKCQNDGQKELPELCEAKKFEDWWPFSHVALAAQNGVIQNRDVINLSPKIATITFLNSWSST